MNHHPREKNRGTHLIDSVTVTVTEQIQPGGSRSFAVRRNDTGTDLTADGAFDDLPTDDDLRQLLAEAANRWRCPGCTTAVDIDDHALKADHMRDCLPTTIPAADRRPE